MATIHKFNGRPRPLLFSFLSLFFISLFFTILSKRVEDIWPMNVSGPPLQHTTNVGAILMVRFLHYMTTGFLVLYMVLFDKSYDIYYIFLYVSLIMYWLLTNDCILSNIEMSYYLDRGDRNGGDGNGEGEGSMEIEIDNRLHPHYRVFAGEYTDWVVILQGIWMAVVFVLVVRRRLRGVCSSWFVFLFCGVVLVLQSYLMLKDRL